MTNSTTTPTLAAVLGRRSDGTFPAAAATLIAIGIVLAFLDLTVLPYLFREGATDWRAYGEAAAQLRAHQNPYAWASAADIRALTAYPYLYPPPLAWIWGFGLNASLWMGLKVASLAALGLFTIRATPLPRQRTLLTGALVGLALAAPAVLHDLILGNVMVLYLAAFAVLAAFPDRRWAVVPLAILIAVAFKPLVAAIAVWLLVSDRARLLDLAAVSVALTIAFAVLIGPGAYIDYLVALPKLGGLAQPFSGNLGLSGVSQPLAFVAIPIALGWAAIAGRRLPAELGLAVAIGLTLIAQPTLGLNYAAVLIPAIILVWRSNRPAGLLLGVTLPLISIFSPPVAGLVVAVTGSIVGWRRRPAADPVSAPVSALA
jgi:hypothetical protein